MKGPAALTDNNFKKEVLESELPVLVDFWASWCPPCKMTEPVLVDLSRELDGRIKVGKINVDQNPQTASDFQIMGVPTFMLFKNGRILKQETGARSKQQLLNMIKEAVTSEDS
jgi:thioredoxin 1